MLVDVLFGESLGRAGKPRLDDQFVELIRGDPLQAHEDRRVAIEMRSGEVDARIIGEQRLLGAEVLNSCCEDRPPRPSR